MLDAGMSLPDGRTLAYTELGAPSGRSVFYFHGAPTSRLDLAGLEDALVTLDVRVISPDRPGYGGSSPQPGRAFEDWPADVTALADHLDVAEFAVIGLSSGGPYSVVCAALLADRVAAAGVVAGVTDFGWSGAWEGYIEDEAVLMRIGDERAVLDACEERYGSDGSRFFDDSAEMSAPDQAFLADETAAAALMATITEAFRQGPIGYAQDIVAQARAWAFDPAAIVVPVRVIHGERDDLVPIAHARHTAEVIPGAVLAMQPDHGHISLFAEIPSLAAQLTN